MLNKSALYRFIVTFGGVGYIKRASGTFGTLAAIPFAALIHYFAGNIGLVIASIIISLVGLFACNAYLKETSKEDPKEVVIDEVAGIFIALSTMPLTIKAYIVGFLLFRFFDIFKPWPVSYADKRLSGGLGVMLDDIFAGLYPIVILMIAVIISGYFTETQLSPTFFFDYL